MQAVPGDRIFYDRDGIKYIGTIQTTYDSGNMATVSLSGIGDVLKTANNFNHIIKGADLIPFILDESATIHMDVINKTLVITT